MKELKICNETLIGSMVSIIRGETKGYAGLISYLAPEIPRARIDLMVNFLAEAKDILGSIYAQKSDTTLPLPKPDTDKKHFSSDAWTLMLTKIKNGTASSKDLFKMVDQEGDNSGTISEQEFYTLTRRLSLSLSSHRITEIFAKIKGGKSKTDDNELNEAEFQKALDYLQQKNLNQALELLGVTPEILTALLIRLTGLLLLIFVFIFLGIKAFAVGGTFGSIISSLFPASKICVEQSIY